MKPDKSPDNTEVTPSKKKLKQARLPFTLISETSPSPDVPQGRKRKLSTPDTESVPKIGKVSKENDDLVVISDDDSKDVPKAPKTEVPINPYVKLVDNARKKKLRKRTPKKKIVKKSKSEETSTENDNEDKKVSNSENSDVVEVMDVDDEGTDDDRVQSDSNIETQQNKNDQNHSEKIDKVEKPVEDSEVIGLDNETTDNNSEIDKKDEKETESNKTEKEEITKEISPVTPKRSMRNRSKIENTTPSSKLNNSTSSELSTPKEKSRSSSVTTSLGDESINDSLTNANLTPKQLQKRLESAKKKEERDKQKQERDQKKQQEKEERAKQRQEKEDQRKKEREEKEEAKRKEKEEKEEQKRKEREEKEQQKELEKKMKEEKEEQKKKEREEREEQKRKEKEAREEERRKKQEALELEKQEQELKKKKAAKAFVNFFVPKQKCDKDQTVCNMSKNSVLSSFTIKSDMRLAPTVRADFTDNKKDNLDQSLKVQCECDLYLKKLQSGTSKPLSSGKTWPSTDKDDDVMIIEDEFPPMDGAGEVIPCDATPREKLRPKLLSFHENRRPPYWGTWRKKSAFVKPRRPFGQDEKQLDYEVDSDDDWEEEQEGESIDGSAAGSDDEQEADEYEVDNEVFVPHGYLSDEEATMDEDDMLSLSPETQKARLKHLEDEFESEMKKPTEKIKPRMYGLIWETIDGGKPDNCVDVLWNYFSKMAMIMSDVEPLLQPSIETEEVEKKKVKKKKSMTTDGEQSPKTDKKKKVKSENKDPKKEVPKKPTQEVNKNQPVINTFLKKLKTS